MARIRTIKPEFQQSASMGAVSREARLTFVLLWPQADDTGRGRADPKMLASVLFPYDDDARVKITEWLFELEREECIHLYEANGHAYFQILKWSEHQKIDRPSPSKFPAPQCKKRKKTMLKPREDSRALDEPDTNARDHSSLDQGREGIKERTKDQGKDQVSLSPRALRAEFDEKFWRVCPKKVGKEAAFKAFCKARKNTDLDTLVSAMRSYALARSGEEDRFTAHPSTWLNAGRWADEAPRPPTANGGTGPPSETLETILAHARALDETNNAPTH